MKRFHLSLLFLILLNLILHTIADVGLDYRLLYVVKLLTYLSGVGIFTWIIRRRSWGFVGFYSSLYLLYPLGVAITWIADGILGAVVGSLLFALVNPPAHSVEHGGYHVRAQFTGFFGACCTYGVYQNQYLLFERQVGQYTSEYPPSQLAALKLMSKAQAIVYYQASSPDSLIVPLR